MGRKKKNEKTIFLKISGVLSDIYSKLSSITNIELKDVFYYGISVHDAMSMTKDDMNAIITSNKRFWLTCKEFDYANALYDACRDSGKVIFIDAPLDGDGKSASQIISWVEKKIESKLTSSDYVLTSNYSIINNNNAILITDLDDDANAWESAGGTAILIPKYYNSLNEIANCDILDFINNAL